MASPDPQRARQLRSRLFVIGFVAAILLLSLLAALLIQRGLEDEDLQDRLEELREQGR